MIGNYVIGLASGLMIINENVVMIFPPDFNKDYLLTSLIVGAIPKTRSNFIAFITEYFYSCFDLIKINSISFYDLPKQNSGKMIYASYSTVESSVISLKTNN